MSQLAAHLVVALIALFVIGGATRVMEAGLACPDWPLCYGSLFPGHQMNVQVFLEWFHRLDAFLVGISLCVQFGASLIWRSKLPKWLPWISASILLLVGFQAGLGAMTVFQLLPSQVVTAHLAVALVLVAIMSGLTQKLLSKNDNISAPLWWRIMSGGSLLLVFFQSLIGGRMATTWGAKRCLFQMQDCQLLELHRSFAGSTALWILIFVVGSLLCHGWSRTQWPFLLTLLTAMVSQVSLGLLSVRVDLSQPIFTVGHQLLAVLLVALSAALFCKTPEDSSLNLSEISANLSLDPTHG